MRLPASILLLLCLCSYNGMSQSCPLGLSGTFRIGPAGGAYPTLTAALADLNTKGLSGPVILELQTGYTSNGEIFPIVLSALPCAGPANTITIRPAAGTSQLSIRSSNTDSTTFDINGGSWYILDGRPGGAGSNKDLSITNANNNGSAIRLIDGAGHNQLQHLDVQGVSTNNLTAVILLDNAATTTGIAYNRIDSCDIHSGAGPAMYGIHALGGLPALNTGNTITGCNIYNLGSSGYPVYGIYFEGEYDSITVSGNNIYYTPDVTVPFYTNRPFAFTGISVGTRHDGGHTVTDNFIGGTQPAAAGSPMTFSGCGQFIGIGVSSRGDSTMTCRVNNNTITNITWNGDYGQPFSMIDLGSNGGFRGTCTGNTIGNSGSGHSLQHFGPSPYSSGSFTFYGISTEFGSVNSADTISGNLIGGILTDSLTPAWVYVINSLATASNGATVIDNNQIGDEHDANSIWIKGGTWVSGINTVNMSFRMTDSSSISNNHIANITGPGPVSGISTQFYSGPMVIRGNSIHDINMTNSNNIGLPTAMTGIGITGDAIADTLTGYLLVGSNRITSLSYTGSYQKQETDGIRITITPGNPNRQIAITHNIIDDIVSPVGYVFGIATNTPASTTSTVDNNMIDLGLTPDGTPLAQTGSQCSLTGITLTGPWNCLHNSIYVHGTGVQYNYPDGLCLEAAATDTIMNNIFAMTFENPPYQGAYFGLIGLGYLTGADNSCDYNLYYFPRNTRGAAIGTGDVLNVGDPDTTLAIWQHLTGHDLHSKFGDPLFIQPEGALSGIDLHLRQGTPAERTGTPAYTTLTDIDGKIRAQYTPVDIGADAGNFGPPGGYSDSEGAADSSNVLKAFPNPFPGNLTLSIYARQIGNATISVYTISGMLISVQQLPVTAGNNTIDIPSNTLADGPYVIRVEVDQRKQSMLVLKRR